MKLRWMLSAVYPTTNREFRIEKSARHRGDGGGSGLSVGDLVIMLGK
jgi:hypothetical protein